MWNQCYVNCCYLGSCRYRGIERSDGAVEATSCPRLSGHRDPTSGDEVGRTSQETGDFFTNNSKKLGLAFQIRPLIKGCLNWLQDEEKAANGGNVTSATPVQSQPKVYDYQVKNYSWDQSEKYVKIYLTDLKNVQSLTDLKKDFVFEPKTSSIQV